MTSKIYMERALELASRGRGRTSPNPMVGAVLVKGGRVIAEGYHKKAGTPHAEVVAIKKAGKNAGGSTLYINLEPCCHTEKRTPPCTKAIIEAGIKKVVAAMTDPNPQVSGKGMRALRHANIETETGVLGAKARRLNEAFIKYISKREPFVILKIAQSLDGKIATAKGESKWITGTKARERVHILRNDVDAVLVGIGTVKADDPSLDCRLKGGRNPFRIIVDSSLQISLNANVLTYGDGKTIIATTEQGNSRKIARISKKGAAVLVLKERAGNVDLKHLMKELGRLDMMSVMIEGGSSISASAMSDKVVDKVMFFVAPKIIGGIDAVGSVGGKSPALLKNACELKSIEAQNYGRDLLIEGYTDF